MYTINNSQYPLIIIQFTSPMSLSDYLDDILAKTQPLALIFDSAFMATVHPVKF